MHVLAWLVTVALTLAGEEHVEFKARDALLYVGGGSIWFLAVAAQSFATCILVARSGLSRWWLGLVGLSLLNACYAHVVPLHYVSDVQRVLAERRCLGTGYPSEMR